MRVAVSSMAAIGLAVFALAAGPASTTCAQEQPIYGRQLMTEQERLEYRERMRAATSEEEREQIRFEHHRQMQERATEMGVELPDEPPAAGMGQGMRQGQGAGPQGGGQGGMRQGGGGGRRGG